MNPDDKADPNVSAERAVRKLTGSKRVKGEDLLGSEELKRAYRDAVAGERERRKAAGEEE